MIATPPHILITNYAMLEYLMLRPRDSVFFDGDGAKHWKFIVLTRRMYITVRRE